jgi:hypothetical protein
MHRNEHAQEKSRNEKDIQDTIAKLKADLEASLQRNHVKYRNSDRNGLNYFRNMKSRSGNIQLTWMHFEMTASN